MQYVMINPFMVTRLTPFLLLLCLTATFASRAQTAKLAEKAPPKEVNPAIQQTLEPKAVQLLEGDTPVLEFWLRKDIPLKSAPTAPDKSLDAFVQPELIGVVAVHKDRRDYKDNELPKGVYTVRFGLQPQDGNHLGTSDYVYFAVLIPSDRDPALDSIKTYKALARASSKGTSTDHPIILSLRPAAAAVVSADLPKINEPVSEHKTIVVKASGKAAGSTDVSPVFFEIVFEGKAHVN